MCGDIALPGGGGRIPGVDRGRDGRSLGCGVLVGLVLEVSWALDFADRLGAGTIGFFLGSSSTRVGDAAGGLASFTGEIAL